MSIFNSMSDFSVDCFSEDDTKKYRNGVFANGIWQKRKEILGTFTVKVNELDGSRLGLKEECKFDFELSLPKAPYVILENILQFYLDIYAKFKSEVYISLFWDIEKQDYFLHVPLQKVSGAVVKFENEEEILNNPNYLLVMESHSHNTMGAQWSAQDRADQKGTRLFSVFGRITTKPEILLTAGSCQQEKVLKIEDIFTKDIIQLKEDSDYTVPLNAESKISEISYATTYTNSSVGYYDYEKYYRKTTPTKRSGSSYKYGSKDSLTLKTKVISSLNAFHVTYGIMPDRLETLTNAFCDYLKEEIVNKNIFKNASLVEFEKTVNFMEEEFMELLSSISNTFDIPSDDFEEDYGISTVGDLDDGYVVLSPEQEESILVEKTLNSLVFPKNIN